MDVQFFLLAKFADLDSDGLLNILGAGIEDVVTDSLPLYLRQFSVVVRFREEILSCHSIRIRFVDPSGEVTLESDTQTLEPKELEDANVSLSFLVQHFPLHKYGTYRFLLIYDDIEIKALPLRVKDQ